MSIDLFLAPGETILEDLLLRARAASGNTGTIYERDASDAHPLAVDTTAARQAAVTRVGLDDLPLMVDTAHLWRDITVTAAGAAPGVTGTDGGTPATAAGTAQQTTSTGRPPSQTGTGRPPAQTASGVTSPYTARGA